MLSNHPIFKPIVTVTRGVVVGSAGSDARKYFWGDWLSTKWQLRQTDRQTTLLGL